MVLKLHAQTMQSNSGNSFKYSIWGKPEKMPECPLLWPLLTKRQCTLRYMWELFANLFLKENPHGTKYFGERLSRNLQALLKEISKKSDCFAYFQVTYQLVSLKVCLPASGPAKHNRHFTIAYEQLFANENFLTILPCLQGQTPKNC